VVRRAKTLAWLSIGWVAIEAGVAIVSALIAGSVALLGFGLDSLIELGSASIVIWRFTGARDQGDTAEHRAQKLIAGASPRWPSICCSMASASWSAAHTRKPAGQER
jgi:hypothetical protein